MATTVGVIHAIGVAAGPAVYLSSLINANDSMLNSRIDPEVLLDSQIRGDSIKFKSKITI